MKLMIIIVQDEDVNKLMKSFTKHNIRVTRLASTGGFLKRGNTTFIAGVEDEQTSKIKEMLKETCKSRVEIMPSIPVISQGMVSASEPIEVRVGGAVVFEVNVQDFYTV